MKNLVIITRMHVSHGSDDNEFVHNWGQDSSESLELFSDGAERKILLVHGCYKEHGSRRYYDPENPEQSVENIIGAVYDQLGNDLEGEELGFLFHPRAEDTDFIGAFENKIGEEFGELANFIEKHWQGAIYENTAIRRLADVIAGKGKGGDWYNTFDEVWETYTGDRELEHKLELLHNCLTPQGAEKYYYNASDEDELLAKVGSAVEELAGYRGGCFDEDYIDKLADLRDRLLGSA